MWTGADRWGHVWTGEAWTGVDGCVQGWCPIACILCCLASGCTLFPSNHTMQRSVRPAKITALAYNAVRSPEADRLKGSSVMISGR